MIGLAMAAFAAPAAAEGELHIYNWGNYTNPDLIKKFEETYKVKVTVTDYDSNDTALAKVRAGGHGFDIVVPSANFVPVWVKEGLLLETRPDQMENFKNVDDRWVNVEWDPGRHYTVPWQWGSTGVLVDTSLYKGDINTAKIILDPPPELAGKINVAPEMNDVMALTIWYLGGEWCTADKELLKKARDTLVSAKKSWISMDYGVIEKFASRDFGAAYYWNGAALRSRLQNKDVRFGYPKDGYPLFMDSVAVLKDAKNVENAKLFQNFIMEPQNAALISAFAKYANGIRGSEQYLPPEMKGAPEVEIPAEFLKAGHFLNLCEPQVTELYSKIWTELLK
ncbi:MAG: extracellular solute-binding protein [Parvibaculaceae bacterium]